MRKELFTRMPGANLLGNPAWMTNGGVPMTAGSIAQTGGQLRTVPMVRGPRDLPALVAQMRADANPDGILEEAYLLDMLHRINPDGFMPDGTKIDSVKMFEIMRDAREFAQSNVGWIRGQLADAHLWWCSSDMTDLVCDAATTMPDDYYLKSSDLPHLQGFVVFERPIYGTDAVAPGQIARIDAVLWGPSRLPVDDDAAAIVYEGDPYQSAISFEAYRRFNEETDGEAVASLNGQELWVPLGRTDWPLDQPLAERSYPSIQDHTWASMQEDRALMAALWVIGAERRIVETSTDYAARPVARRIERSKTPVSTKVTVMHLRREIPKASDADEIDDHPDAEKRRVGVRFLVKAHLRNQAFGPGRRDRKLIVVPPHIRGPEGAPLVRRPKVWSLDR